MAVLPIFIKAYWSLAFLGLCYFCFLGLLTLPVVQKNAIYVHRLRLTRLSDLIQPEQFGFAKNQVTPFHYNTSDGEAIFAWHVLPLGAYMMHREVLVKQHGHGVVAAPLGTKNIQLLKDDPEARLIIHFHGNAGTVGAGYRPSYLRSLSAAHPTKIHILAIDYRGFGLSTGDPTEDGLITDGISAVRFAVDQLGIPPSRIALVGQSLGAAVTIGVADKLAAQSPPVELAAVITIAGFSSMKELLLTYRIGGYLPVLAPLRGYPKVQKWFSGHLRETWDSAARLATLVKNSPNLNLVLIHARDDYDIPWQHCDSLFVHAASAARKTIEGEDTKMKVSDALASRIITTYGNESTHAIWPEERSNGRRIGQWVVKWGGHNAVVTSAGTSVIVAKAIGLGCCTCLD